MTPMAPGAGSSRGMILIVVLWAVAMMTIVVVALSAFSQKSIATAGVEADRLRTEMALAAGIEAGKAIILAARPEDRVFLDGQAVTVEIGNGRAVRISVRDAAGMVDLNRADPELIEAFGARLEAAIPGVQSILEDVMKLRGNQTKEKEEATAQPPETGETASGDPPAPLYQPAILISTLQLYGLANADPAAVDKLLPLITLYSVDGKVNPMAAPVEIMSAIPGLQPKDAAVLADARKLRQRDSEAVQEVLAAAPKFLGIGQARVFNIAAAVVSGSGVIAGSRIQATAILDEGSAGPAFQILSWSW